MAHVWYLHKHIDDLDHIQQELVKLELQEGNYGQKISKKIPKMAQKAILANLNTITQVMWCVCGFRLMRWTTYKSN